MDKLDKNRTPQRDGKGRFAPGTPSPAVSPGRPPIIRPIRELAREHTDTAFKALLDIARTGENESARVAASNIILDRGWGKAVQVIDTPEDGVFAGLASLLMGGQHVLKTLQQQNQDESGKPDDDGA